MGYTTELFLKHCDLHGLKYSCTEAAPGEGGMYINVGGESIKMTPDILMAICGFGPCPADDEEGILEYIKKRNKETLEIKGDIKHL